MTKYACCFITRHSIEWQYEANNYEFGTNIEIRTVLFYIWYGLSYLWRSSFEYVSIIRNMAFSMLRTKCLILLFNCHK